MSSSVSWNVLSDQYNNDEVFSTKIRAAIDPPVPLHLKVPANPIAVSAKKNPGNQEDSKLKTPFDKIERKLHLLVPNKGEFVAIFILWVHIGGYGGIWVFMGI